MRIGLVTACYTPVVNGVVRMVALYKKYLEEVGHQVTVFTLGANDQQGYEEGVIRSPALPLGKTGYHLSTRYSSAAQDSLRQMDLLHCHHPVMGLELAHRYGSCPVVFTNHTRYDLYLSAYSPLSAQVSESVMRRVWPAMAEFADVVIAPSKSIRELLLSMGVSTPVELIVNGIELNAFYAAAKLREEEKIHAKRIIYVGRLSPEKNVLALMSEFIKAQQIDGRLHLTIVGDGPQRDRLEQLAYISGVKPFVTFTGELEYSQIPGELAKADLFATSSVSEVHPLTVIEAMATGLPVVANESPGISDIVEDGVTGLLGQDGEGALASRLLRLAKSPERTKRMGRAAAQASSHYRIQNTVVKTLELYQRLLADQPTAEGRNRRRRRRGSARISSLRAFLPHSIRSKIRERNGHE